MKLKSYYDSSKLVVKIFSSWMVFFFKRNFFLSVHCAKYTRIRKNKGHKNTYSRVYFMKWLLLMVFIVIHLWFCYFQYFNCIIWKFDFRYVYYHLNLISQSCLVSFLVVDISDDYHNLIYLITKDHHVTLVTTTVSYAVNSFMTEAVII